MSKLNVSELDADELENLYEEIQSEKEERKIRKLSDDELVSLEKEVEAEIENKKGKGKINSDPVIQLE